MNYVQKLLYSTLHTDVINLLALQERDDDYVWLEEHGYFVRGPMGGVTEKGKAYIERQNAKFDELYKKTRKHWNSDKIRCLRKELMEYQRTLQNGSIYDGLTETEMYAVRYLIKGW